MTRHPGAPEYFPHVADGEDWSEHYRRVFEDELARLEAEHEREHRAPLERAARAQVPAGGD